MKCPNCNNENRESAKYCDECGFPLTEAIVRASMECDDPPSDDQSKGDQECEDSPIDAGEVDDLKQDNASESKEVDYLEASPTEAISVIDDEGEQASDESASHDNVSGDVEPIEADTDVCPVETQDADREAPSEEDQFSMDATRALDSLSEYDEPDAVLADSSYQKPQGSWRDGHTMKMEPIADDDEPKSKDYLASSTAKSNPRGRRVALIAGIVVVAVLLVGLITYALELWGGKSIPDVTGLTESEASTILRDEGFEVQSLDVRSDDTEGLVLVMDPSAGSRAAEGSQIVIHVATARLVPEIIGAAKDEAAEMLEECGFTNVKFEEKRSSLPSGQVISVSPEVGERAKSGDEILVAVAKPYTVPDISNMYLSDAQKAIEDEGLTSEVEYVYTEDYEDGIIIGTNPPAKTEVQEGSIVTIQISRSREAECIALTQSYLAPGNTINVGLYGYEIESIDSLDYVADDTVAYSVTARPFITGFGETAYFSAQPLAGQIVWTASNEIASMT